MVKLLNCAMSLATYNVIGQRLNHVVYRKLYRESFTFAGVQRLRRSWLVNSAEVENVPEELFQQLIETITHTLHAYIDPKKGRITFSTPPFLSVSYPNPDLKRFARQVIRCSALFGAARTVQLLRGWADGEPMHYTWMLVLNGVTQEEEHINLSEGTWLKRLSTDDDFFQEVPEQLARRSAGGDDSIEKWLPGRTVLCLRREIAPAIHAPGTDYDPFHGLKSHSPPFDTVNRILRTLSLVCDSPVEVMHEWISCDERIAPLTGCVESFQSHRMSQPIRVRQGKLTPENAKRAVDLDSHLHSSDSTVTIAIARWMRSKLSHDSVSAAIDIRVALEALLLSGHSGSGELSFRLALRGAWYLGEDAAEREKYLQSLKEIYRACSIAIHTGSLKGVKGGTEVGVRRVTEAQCICRSALLKRLDDGRAPDWDKLILSTLPIAQH